ncbi:unnamed protein product, partial [Scytosiphon promiscuus]
MRRRKKDKVHDKVSSSSTDHEALDSSGKGGSAGGSSKSSKNVDPSHGVTAVSPPLQQQRKRSLLGSLGSMRDLVEQVQDSLTKTKQDASSSSGGGRDKDRDKDRDNSSNTPMSAGSSTHSSAEKPQSSSRIASILSGSSNHGGSSGGGGGGSQSSHRASSLFGPFLDMKGGSSSKDRDKDKDAAAGAGSGSAPGSPVSFSASNADARALAIVGGGSGGASGGSTKKKVLDLKLLPSGTSLALRLKKQAQVTPSPSEFKARERQDLADQPFCGVCATPFTLMVRRQRCAVCGESVCAQCSSDKRHVEGQKGLQRVCDICIVEGPVVLDDNGMYARAAGAVKAAALSSSSTPTSSALTAVTKRSPTTTTAAATVTPTKPSKSRAAATPATKPLQLAAATTTVTALKSPAARSTGEAEEPRSGPLPSPTAFKPPRSPVTVTTVIKGKSSGPHSVSWYGLADGPAREARGEVLPSPLGNQSIVVRFPLVFGRPLCAQGGGGPPSTSAPSSKGSRKRGKKARRASGSDTKSSQDRRQLSWSGQSFSDYGAGAGTPGTRSSRSTPRGNGFAGAAAPLGWELQGKLQAAAAAFGEQAGAFARDFIRGAGIHRLDPRRLSGKRAGSMLARRGTGMPGAAVALLSPRDGSRPLQVVVSGTGLDRAWDGAWVLLRKLLEKLLEVAQERGSGRTGGGGRSKRGAGGSRGGNAHHHHHVWVVTISRSEGSQAAALLSFPVTHPEVTTEHVFGAASSLFFALAAFLVRAAADLTIDACGAVIPSLCGTREARLAAAYRRLQLGGGAGESGGREGGQGASGDGPGVAGME